MEQNDGTVTMIIRVHINEAQLMGVDQEALESTNGDIGIEDLLRTNLKAVFSNCELEPLSEIDIKVAVGKKIGEDIDKPKLKLVGIDGNAFTILGTIQRACKKARWSKRKIDRIMDEAKSGDYDKLLQTAMKYFEVE